MKIIWLWQKPREQFLKLMVAENLLNQTQYFYFYFCCIWYVWVKVLGLSILVAESMWATYLSNFFILDSTNHRTELSYFYWTYFLFHYHLSVINFKRIVNIIKWLDKKFKVFPRDFPASYTFKEEESCASPWLRVL